VLVSALRSVGKPRLALEMAEAGLYRLILSEAVLLELDDVLERKFGWSKRLRANTLRGLRTTAELVEPNFVLTDCVDPDDNRILEAAVAGRSHCIVSGDKHLLRMGRFQGVEIVTVSDFLVLTANRA
jgi:uncharacterized protein